MSQFRPDETGGGGEDELGFLHGMNINHLVRILLLLNDFPT